MPRKSPRLLPELVRKLVQTLFPGKNHSPVSHTSQRHLKFEPLEGRALMAADLASLAGNVTLDGNPVVGATIHLYLDQDNDTNFEPGGDDIFIDTDTTASGGAYRFDRLAAGNYFLLQPSQAVGTTYLNQDLTLISITTQAQGTLGISIDDFANVVAQSITATNGTPTASDATDYANALGGERDLFAQLVSGGVGESVTLSAGSGSLAFSSTSGAQGQFSAIYDGNDSDATTLGAFSPAVDLTDAGDNTALRITVKADQSGTTAFIRVYSSPTNFSETTLFAIPGTNVDTDVVAEFAEDFSTGTGATGPADFTAVTAIELIAETGTDGTTGSLTLLGAFGPSVITENITNTGIDLVVDKQVSDSTPNNGQSITFTMTVTNSSTTDDATNIVLTDTFDFTTLGSIVSTPEAGTTFTIAGNNLSGTWTIPLLAAGETVTLTITGNNLSVTQRTNTLAVTSFDQSDDDNTNNTDSAQLTPNALDLVVEKQVTDSTPSNGQSITFTMTVQNPSSTITATNVVLTDTFDFSTLTNVVATPESGSTFDIAVDQQTGTWSIPSLAPNTTATLTITATNNSSATRTNTIALTSLDQFDLAVGNNTDSVQLTSDTLDLVVDKQVNDSTPDNGQSVTFTVTVTNSSSTVTATNIELTDTFDFSTLGSIVSTPQSGSTFVLAGNNQSGLWTIPSLAPNTTATLTITGNNNAATQRTNSVAVTDVDQFDTNTANNTDSVQLTPNTLDLVVDKQVSDATPNNGQSITFTMTVTNSSSTQTATNVVLTDTFDFTTLGSIVSTPQAGSTFVIAGNNQSGTWTIPSLAPNTTATLTITANNTSATTRTNTLAIASLDQFDTNSNNDSDNVQLTPNTLDLVVSKSVDDSTPNNGQSITFTITVTNSSSTEAASNVVLTDTFDFSTLGSIVSTPQSGSTFVIAGNNQSGTWTIPTLAANGTATLTITGNNNSQATRSNTIALTSLDQFDTSTGNNTDTEQLTPNTLDLVVVKQVNDSTPNNGQSVTFTITVTNSSSTTTATGVVLTDTFDFSTLTGLNTNAQSGTTFTVAGNNQSGTWNIPSLAPNTAATLTITGNNNVSTQRTNTIAVTSLDQFDTSAANNTASQQLTPNRADLRLAKTANLARPAVGQNVTFTLTLTNDGPDQATNVNVTDTLPAGLTFVSSNPSVGTFSSGTGVWNIPTLNSGANATLQIVATATATGSKINVAQVTAADQFDPDSTPNDNTGDDRATVELNAQRLSKRRFLAR